MGTWRVGRSQPRNLYIDDEMVGVLVGLPDDAAKLASAIVIAMNALEGYELGELPANTRVEDCQGDVWIRGKRGWGLEGMTGSNGDVLTSTLEENWAPFKVLPPLES